MMNDDEVVVLGFLRRRSNSNRSNDAGTRALHTLRPSTRNNRPRKSSSKKKPLLFSSSEKNSTRRKSAIETSDDER